MKKFIFIIAILSVSFSFAQTAQKVMSEKIGDLTEVTYFNENGKIAQQGTFNDNGKLHGVWTSYDLSGKKVAVGNYSNGEKVGKWFFWTSTSLKEVDYNNSKITNVIQWDNSTNLAVRN